LADITVGALVLVGDEVGDCVVGEAVGAKVVAAAVALTEVPKISFAKMSDFGLLSSAAANVDGEVP